MGEGREDVRGLVLAAIIILADACSSTFPPTPVPPVPDRTGVPLLIAGTGRGNSEAFRLAGGDYAIAWTMIERGSCVVASGWLKQLPSGFPAEHIFSGDIDAETSGTSFVYSVEPARYYVHNTGDCSWTATFTSL